MIKTFADRHTLEVYRTARSRRLPADLLRRAVRRLEYLDHATSLENLKTPPSNRLQARGFRCRLLDANLEGLL